MPYMYLSFTASLGAKKCYLPIFTNEEAADVWSERMSHLRAVRGRVGSKPRNPDTLYLLMPHKGFSFVFYINIYNRYVVLCYIYIYICFSKNQGFFRELSLTL